jgi:MOSC domain-containing protein YiiM
MTGRVAGIARHAERRGPIETLMRVRIAPGFGVEGDRNGAKLKRQVSLIEAQDWAAAMGEVGADLPWWQRRSNLLVEGLDLPQRPGARLRVGAEVLLEVQCQIDPCERMDELHPGLRRALEPDWRGGVGARVIEGGEVCVGDEIKVEQE